MDEESIYAILPPYQFRELDKALALQIRGLNFSHMANAKPLAPIFHFEISNGTTKEELLEFFATVPEEFEIEYFHPIDSQRNVGGAAVRVQKDDFMYAFHHGNLSRHNTWLAISAEMLLGELFKYRHHQRSGNIRVFRMKKKAIVGESVH